MNRSVRVAVLQLRAHGRDDFERSFDAIVAAAAEASKTADLVVLPEGTVPAYVLGDAPVDDTATDFALDRLAAVAKRTGTVIVAGAVRSGKSLRRNAAMVIDRDGSLAGRADKLFLWHFDRRWFEPGERIAPVDTTLGKLGVLVCADGRIPTIARALVDRGAEMLVMPTAWVTSGRNPKALENVQADLLARVRAYENGVPFIAANKCGAELGMVAYCGKSQAIDANGEIVAIAGELEPATLAATVAIGTGRPRRTKLPRPAPRGPLGHAAPVRIAISVDPLPHDVDRRLDLLDDAYVIAAPFDGAARAALDAAVPTAGVCDDEMLDPAGLAAYRRAGYAIAVWTTQTDSPWIERIARARALELRMYVVVLDCSRAMRAFAVDPDGVAIAGTFGDYRLASFSFDPRKTMETAVAPGTDIVDGLERIAAIVERGDETQT
ncbi:MAG: carbon-nitrogen hydrolase family protein [Candidatus Tumulicola sp.]